MALLDIFKNIGQNIKNAVHAKMMSGYIPVFSQFGDNIYASDVVQNCIDRIATEISKLQPRHIQTDNETGMQKIPASSINRLLKFSPNELMTTRDFLEKVIWQLYLNYNCFIYPKFYEVSDASGKIKRYYEGFYPLNPVQVDFLQDEKMRLFVRLYFSSGENYTLPYVDIIHLRKKFSVNDIMGGGMNGQPDNAALLKTLQINDTVLQGLEKGIRTSMAIRGLMKIATLMDNDAQKAERTRFEQRLKEGDSGIMVMDLKGEFTPINLDPKLVDKDTLAFIEAKVLHWYGVSLEILSGKYTDDDYQAFYETTLEPILIGLGQAFSKCLFTQRELEVGNEIVFYQRDMMYLSTKSKLELLKTAGEQGLLDDDQKLAILGYPPLADGTGKRRTQSLNYIDVKLINQYQLKGGKPAKETKE